MAHRRPRTAKEEDKSPWMIRGVPVRLRRSFIAHCYERGTTAGEMITDVLRKFLKQEHT